MSPRRITPQQISRRVGNAKEWVIRKLGGVTAEEHAALNEKLVRTQANLSEIDQELSLTRTNLAKSKAAREGLIAAAIRRNVLSKSQREKLLADRAKAIDDLNFVIEVKDLLVRKLTDERTALRRELDRETTGRQRDQAHFEVLLHNQATANERRRQATIGTMKTGIKKWKDKAEAAGKSAIIDRRISDDLLRASGEIIDDLRRDLSKLPPGKNVSDVMQDARDLGREVIRLQAELERKNTTGEDASKEIVSLRNKVAALEEQLAKLPPGKNVSDVMRDARDLSSEVMRLQTSQENADAKRAEAAARAKKEKKSLEERIKEGSMTEHEARKRFGARNTTPEENEMLKKFIDDYEAKKAERRKPAQEKSAKKPAAEKGTPKSEEKLEEAIRTILDALKKEKISGISANVIGNRVPPVPELARTGNFVQINIGNNQIFNNVPAARCCLPCGLLTYRPVAVPAVYNGVHFNAWQRYAFECYAGAFGYSPEFHFMTEFAPSIHAFTQLRNTAMHMQMPEELMMQSNAFFEHYVKSPMDHFFRPGCERISNLNELIALEMLQSRPACISEFSNLMGMYGNPGISFMQFEMARIASAARLNSYAFFPHF